LDHHEEGIVRKGVENSRKIAKVFWKEIAGTLIFEEGIVGEVDYGE